MLLIPEPLRPLCRRRILPWPPLHSRARCRQGGRRCKPETGHRPSPSSAALAESEAPEVLDGLGQALWWQSDLRLAIELRERAYALFLGQGNLRAAAGIGVFLAREYFTVHGNLAVSAGWVQRTERLVSKVGDCPERGWLEMLKGRVAQDGDQMLRHAETATRLAREAADPDLEIVALSLRGLALVH